MSREGHWGKRGGEAGEGHLDKRGGGELEYSYQARL